MAINNERRLLTYYKRKLLASSSETVKDLFRELVKEEEKHIKILNDQLQSLQADKIWKNIREIEDSRGF